MWEELGLSSASFAASLLLSVLLYNSFWGSLLFIPVWYFLRKWYRSKKKEKTDRKLSEDFLAFLEILKGELLAGLSAENAFWNSCDQLKEERGEQSPIYKKLSEMRRQSTLNMPVEELFWRFAEASDQEEIRDFAEVFRYAKRSGGDLRRIIDGSVRKIRERYETENELMLMVAGKKLEQKVMSGIPILLLIYMRVTNPSYMSVLYGNVQGVLFMTGCGAAYAVCLYFSDRIMHLQF